MTNENEKPVNEQPTSNDDETRLLTLKNFLIISAGIILLIIFVQGLAAALLAFTSPYVGIEITQVPTDEFPEPRLQEAPVQDFQELKATQQTRLNSYGYVNREAGVVHIPVQRAMEIVATRGLPIEFAEGAPVAATPEVDGTPSPVQQGQLLFQELGCDGCHQETDTQIAPALIGIFGEQRTLQDGRTVTVDEEYLRQSILNPSAAVVEGYNPIMPSYEDRVTQEQLDALVAYIQSLSNQ